MKILKDIQIKYQIILITLRFHVKHVKHEISFVVRDRPLVSNYEMSSD